MCEQLESEISQMIQSYESEFVEKDREKTKIENEKQTVSKQIDQAETKQAQLEAEIYSNKERTEELQSEIQKLLQEKDIYEELTK